MVTSCEEELGCSFVDDGEITAVNKLPDSKDTSVDTTVMAVVLLPTKLD